MESLEPLLATLTKWGQGHAIRIVSGVLELAETFPTITIVAFDPKDLDTFCALAEALPATTLVVNAPPLSEEDLKLATGLVPRLKHPPERRHYQQVIADASSHLGEVQQIRAVAFGPGFQRAIILQASADWGEEVFSLARLLEQPDE